MAIELNLAGKRALVQRDFEDVLGSVLIEGRGDEREKLFASGFVRRGPDRGLRGLGACRTRDDLFSQFNYLRQSGCRTPVGTVRQLRQHI